MTSKPILIFPAGMSRALEFQQQCTQTGRKTIGASSLAFDVSKDQYAQWTYLPFVSDPAFTAALKKVLIQFNVGEIFTPNLVVWNYLHDLLPTLELDVVLTNQSPSEEIVGPYRKSLKRTAALASAPLSVASTVPPRHALSAIEVASLTHYANIIPGMCDDDKFHALLEIASYAVDGDLVEIGSWWGKSAFILAFLASRFFIGKLLCVDPWDNAHLVQNEKIVDSGSAQVDASEALSIFQINLLPFNQNHINYLRTTSVEAASIYRQKTVVSSEAFGSTQYCGEIAILHIDGNHTYEAAKADVDAWCPFVLPGGWIIVDDYVWPYGDGPRRVGDEFLEKNQTRVSTAFVMGSALFIQLSRVS